MRRTRQSTGTWKTASTSKVGSVRKSNNIVVMRSAILSIIHIQQDRAETGQQSPRQRPDGDRRSDDGKPRDKVSDTVRNMAAGEPAKKFTVGQQVFLDFLR